ncbi:MAG: hypothetical protein IJC18_01755, partial [Clostridia bacterium]|nr:hypothetical protein [Clostridia bacterium]
TAFRNGEYAVVATDKAGNTSKKTVTVSNINATPFNLLSMYASLSEKDFTPSTWAVAKAAASELQGLLTLGSADTLVDAAAEKLAASLEALVHRGDGTLTLELVERVLQNDPEQYTASSWERVLLCIDAIDEVLDDPECTQADIDAARHALEQAVSELRVRGDFTSLDRLIKQCERVNAADYDADIFLAFEEILEQAKDMSRIDSTQDDVNTMYRTLLDSYGALSKKEEKKGFSPTTLSFVVVGLLIIAAGTALFIVNKRSKQSAARDEAQDAYDDADEYTDDFGSHADTLAGSFGDFHFIDDEESDV